RLLYQATPSSRVAAMPLYTPDALAPSYTSWSTGRSPLVHWLVWPLMQWSTDRKHSFVHVQMHEQMHVHAERSCDHVPMAAVCPLARMLYPPPPPYGRSGACLCSFLCSFGWDDLAKVAEMCCGKLDWPDGRKLLL